MCREKTPGTLLPARPGLAPPPSELPPTAFVFNVLGLFFLFYLVQIPETVTQPGPGLPGTNPSPKLLFVVVSEMLRGPPQAPGCREGGGETAHKRPPFLPLPWIPAWAAVGQPRPRCLPMLQLLLPRGSAGDCPPPKPLQTCPSLPKLYMLRAA